MECREVVYAGRVQGVGFRYTATTVAKQYAVTGFVKNLDDGRVQLVVEGSAGEVDTFLDALAERMGGNVRSTTMQKRPVTGTWTSFRTEQ